MLRSESLALGLEEEAIIDGRMRGGRLVVEDVVGAGESGVEAFFVSPLIVCSLVPGEEKELIATG